MRVGLITLLICAAGVQAETHVWLGGDGAYATPGKWDSGVVPSAGDSVVISNGSVTVTAADTFAELASVTLGENGALVCNETVETTADVAFGVSNILDVTAGELVFHGYAGGTGFTKEGAGRVRFTGGESGVTAWLPGLRECRLPGSFNLASPNTGTRVSTGLDMANTVWPADYTDTTFAYAGEIYLDGSRYTFAERVDDNAYLEIGGTVVLSNSSYTAVSEGSIQPAAGWHPINLRVGNASGAGGSLNVHATGGGIAWRKEGAVWQRLRDFSGGMALRAPGRLAAGFSEGITLNNGSVVVLTETAAGSAGDASANSLGALALNAGTLILSNAACRASALDGNASALLRLDLAGLTLSNETDSVYPGKTSGVGTLIKDGAGRLQWQARSVSHYAHSATIVNNGMVALGDSGSWLGDYNFGTFTVNQPGMVNTLINGNTQFDSLWGDGVMTNSTGLSAYQQLRIQTGPCEFAGIISGKIRYYSRGNVALTGTDSTFAGNFAVHSSGGPGITGLKKIGLTGQPSSMGTSGTIDIRENGGTLRYLGTGETTDKNFLLYPSGTRAVIDGGAHGGVTFNGKWSTTGGRLVRLALKGTNAAPCVFNGEYNEHSMNGTNYSTYIAKEDPGVWVFKHHAGRSNRGVIDVREGTLQFESIAEAGQICSLGRSDLLFEDVINNNTNGLGVAYAFSLGTPSTTGTLEYIGAYSASCATRRLVLQGDGRLKSDGAPLSFSGGVESLTAGGKTLYLDGGATNALGTVADGAGTVGITKEGSGTWCLAATNAFTGPLEVKAGRVVLDKRGYAYYRFNLLQRNYGNTVADTNIELTEFALYSADGVRRNLNLAKNGTNNVSALRPGEFCPMGSYQTYGVRNDDKLFDGDSDSQWTVNTVGFLPHTPIRLVMRLAEDTPPITGYDLQYWPAAADRFLSGWSVEGSRDGVTWDLLDSVMDYQPVPPAGMGGTVKWWYSTGTVTPGNGFAIADGVVTQALLAADVRVGVSDGAELAVLGGTETLSALAIDYDAGGGTVRGVTLAPNGRLDVTGTTMRGLNLVLPLTIPELGNPGALASWSLYINNELIPGVSLSWDAKTGMIRVSPLGTLMLFR
jgi:autotransporter-associated beta strand protein